MLKVYLLVIIIANFLPSMSLLLNNNRALINQAEQIDNHNITLKDSPNQMDQQTLYSRVKASKRQVMLSNKVYKTEVSDIILGNANAKVVLIEYFSPTCLHCVNYHKLIFPEIKHNFIDSGLIQYVIREFIGNKQDLDATILARCSNDIEDYLKFINIILENQENWVYNKNYQDILTNIGVMGGVSAKQYAMCLHNKEKIQSLIVQTKLIAEEPSFLGTPTFFINGKQCTTTHSIQELSHAINIALKENE